VLKKSLEKVLPNEVLYRPKMGFAVPLDTWFRGSLENHMVESLSAPELVDSGVFDPTVLAKIADDHRAGRRDYSAILWALLMFQGFLSG
jgi:asparagine synthase (glutamine-hydrolysing)